MVAPFSVTTTAATTTTATIQTPFKTEFPGHRRHFIAMVMSVGAVTVLTATVIAMRE